MIITTEMIMSWGSCQPDYPEEKIRGIIGDGKTLLEICDLDVPEEHRIWDFQELEHWNSIKDEESWEKLSLHYEFYQLKEILEPENGSFSEYPDETFMVAEKVIKYLCKK